MVKGFQQIFSMFYRDMEKSGVFVAFPVRDESWKDPSFRFYVGVGLYNHPEQEIRTESMGYVPEEILRDNKRFLSPFEMECLLDFRADRSNKETKKRGDYELILPGHIESPVKSLRGMADGVRLITTLESWAYAHGELVDTSDTSKVEKTIRKHFILDKGKFNL